MLSFFYLRFGPSLAPELSMTATSSLPILPVGHLKPHEVESSFGYNAGESASASRGGQSALAKNQFHTILAQTVSTSNDRPTQLAGAAADCAQSAAKEKSEQAQKPFTEAVAKDQTTNPQQSAAGNESIRGYPTLNQSSFHSATRHGEIPTSLNHNPTRDTPNPETTSGSASAYNVTLGFSQCPTPKTASAVSTAVNSEIATAGLWTVNQDIQAPVGKVTPGALARVTPDPRGSYNSGPYSELESSSKPNSAVGATGQFDDAINGVTAFALRVTPVGQQSSGAGELAKSQLDQAPPLKTTPYSVSLNSLKLNATKLDQSTAGQAQTQSLSKCSPRLEDDLSQGNAASSNGFNSVPNASHDLTSRVALPPLHSSNQSWNSAIFLNAGPANGSPFSDHTVGEAIPSGAGSSSAPVSDVTDSDFSSSNLPVRTVQVTLPGAEEQQVHLIMSERAGGLSVSVRATDPALTRGLQEHLPELSARLESEHYQTEIWLPAATETISSAQSQQQTADQYPGQSGGGGRSFSQGDASSSGGDRNQRQGGQPNNPQGGWRQFVFRGQASTGASQD